MFCLTFIQMNAFLGRAPFKISKSIKKYKEITVRPKMGYTRPCGDLIPLNDSCISLCQVPIFFSARTQEPAAILEEEC